MIALAKSERLTETHIDDLPVLVHPVHASDLCRVLAVVPGHRRPAVVLAFTDLTEEQWATAAGMSKMNVWRWLHGEVRLPFGAAARLGRVVGVSAELLFEGWI